MSKGATQSRRRRRGQFRAAGYLTIKRMFGRFSGEGEAWYSKMYSDGREAHDAHYNRIQDEKENQLQTKLNEAKEFWKGVGYNDEEVAMLEEAWLMDAIIDKSTYREDRKEAKRLRKAAKESLNSRANANG